MVIPGITWPSVAAAVLECGAIPVTADIALSSYCVTESTIASKLTSKTRALIPTHLYCSQVDMEPVLQLARSKGLIVIEDAAQAIGTRRYGRAAGTWGDFGIFSLNQRKVLACGEGGVLITDNPEKFSDAREIHMIESTRSHVPSRLPATFKISEFQASIALTQLAKLPDQLRRIEDNALYLEERLRRFSNMTVLERLPGTSLQSYYNFCVDVRNVDDMSWLRSAIAAELNLEISPVYRPIADTLDLRADGVGKSQRPYAFEARLQNCEDVFRRRSLRFPHYALRGSAGDMDIIVMAFEKVMTAR